MLNLLRRMGQRRPAPPRDFPIEEVELRHIDGPVADLVRRRFIERQPAGIADGERSILLPHPEKPGVNIKIKGAGLFGGSVLFGTWHKTGPVAPLFDFEGRMMEDVASGHDNAYHGGASFQQAATEFRMARLLADLGYRVVPCLGYGRVRHGAFASWFSVHELRADWQTISPGHFSLDHYLAAKDEIGRHVLDLAVRHGIVGYASAVGAPIEAITIKDLHPFRMADPLSMSQLSWVMQLFFGLHILSLGAIHAVRRKYPDNAEALVHAQIGVFRAVCPDVTLDDHEALRRQLVAPYMLRRPADFDPQVLQRVLSGNRLTRALLEVCPADYARY